MYLLKSNLSGLFISDDKGLMTSYPGKALSFIDEAAGNLYMAKHGFSQQYYSLFPEVPTNLYDELKKELKNNKENDLINHPNHYTAYSREVIDTMQGDMTPEEFTGYLKGNIIKYISRYQGKNGVEDLNKAIWYATKLRDVVKDMKDEQKPKVHPFIKVDADEL